MLFIPPTPFRPRRRIKAKKAQATGPLEIVNISDIDANPTGVAFTLTLNVNAGFTLTNIASADPTQWTARYNGKTGSGEALEAVTPSQLRVWIAFDGVEAGTNEFSFSADPEDVGDTQGRKLGAIDGQAL